MVSFYRWGCDHEKLARESYEVYLQHQHDDVKIEDCGLHINPEIPFMGASPDGLVECACCEKGLLEIKCPFCTKNESLLNKAEQKGFCLKVNDGKMQLDKSHAYYFQVQAQIFVTKRAYCDFVVWTEESELFVERIMPDPTMFQESMEKAKLFYKVAILPELLAKVYTCELEPAQSSSTETTDVSWCFCQTKQQEPGMINCKSTDCSIKFFHLKCLGLKNVPKRQWFCPNCRKVKSAKS